MQAFAAKQSQRCGHEAAHPDTPRNPAPGAAGLPHREAIQRSFGHHDLSQIRVDTDRTAARRAWSLGADALTCGTNVTFLRPPSLFTAAHEAAHVIQQQTGSVTRPGHADDVFERHADQVAGRVAAGQSSEALLNTPPGSGSARPGTAQAVVQMRRMPPNIRNLLIAVSGGQGANYDANAEGVRRLIELALAELTQAEHISVLGRLCAGMTIWDFFRLPPEEQLTRSAEAILAVFPGLELGDPALLDVHARPSTTDTANINTVVARADAIFSDIVSGAHDDWLTQVFGAAHVSAAKAKYASAQSQMNHLSPNHVVTDRGSGFSREVFEGGLTGPDQISVAPDVIDDPNNIESIMTMLHESMHAGNDDVGDEGGYINSTGFVNQSAAMKLMNAAHYEVVGWRVVAPGDARAYPADPPTSPPTFQTFVPAGTTVGAYTAPSRTDAEEGAVQAYCRVRDAWALGLNLHREYVHLYRTPTDWTVPQYGGSVLYNDSIPFWSKVEKMTVHRKTDIDPASSDEARHPVSQIDLALSEGLTRKLAYTMDVLGPLETESDVETFEWNSSSFGEYVSAFMVGTTCTPAERHRDFLLRLAVRQPSVNFLTGNVDRDFRVLETMGDPALSLWSDILRPRDPATFPD